MILKSGRDCVNHVTRLLLRKVQSTIYTVNVVPLYNLRMYNIMYI